MADQQHRATAGEWASIRARADDIMVCSTILELRHRIEALEAAQQAHADASHVIDPEKEKMAQGLAQAAGFTPRPSKAEGWHYIKDLYGESADSPPQPNHPEIPDGSLKERIKSRIILSEYWKSDVVAATVLVEVATWLRKQSEGYFAPGSHWAKRLEQEAKR